MTSLLIIFFSLMTHHPASEDLKGLASDRHGSSYFGTYECCPVIRHRHEFSSLTAGTITLVLARVSRDSLVDACSNFHTMKMAAFKLN